MLKLKKKHYEKYYISLLLMNYIEFNIPQKNRIFLIF